jgi:hypothetical protein
MKKYLKMLALPVLFTLMFMGIQNILFMIWMVIIGLIEGIRAGMGGYELDPETLEAAASGISYAAVLTISSVLSLLIFWALQRKEWERIYFWRISGISVASILLCLALGPPLNLFTGGAVYLTNLLEIFPGHNELMADLVGHNIFIEIITVALLVPVVEEVLFRGIIQRHLQKTGLKTQAVIGIQALFFAFVHMNIVQGIYTFAAGIIFGIIYWHFKTIWAPIAVHITYNMISVIASNIPVDADLEVEELTDPEYAVMTVIAFVVSAILLFFILKRPKGQEETYEYHPNQSG